MTPPSTDLLDRARRGDGEAVEALVGRLGPRLLGLVRLRLGRSLRRRVESRDVVQEVLLKAWTGLDRFEGDGSSTLMGWLGRIAENEIRDLAAFHGRHRRDAKQEVALPEREALGKDLRDRARSVTSRLVWSERAERLEQAFEELEEEPREVVVLRRFEELSYPEIGERLGKSADACRMMYARAMARVTARLADETDEEAP